MLCLCSMVQHNIDLVIFDRRYVQKYRKICGLGCVNHARARAQVTQPSPRIFPPSVVLPSFLPCDALDYSNESTAFLFFRTFFGQRPPARPPHLAGSIAQSKGGEKKRPSRSVGRSPFHGPPPPAAERRSDGPAPPFPSLAFPGPESELTTSKLMSGKSLKNSAASQMSVRSCENSLDGPLNRAFNV